MLLRDALLIVLDPTQEDLEHVREQLYARASHEELVKAVACVDQIARPHGTHHYEELISRYRSVRLFLPKLLELPFEGLPAGQIVLWNTRYMDAVLSKLQADGDAIADADARRLSPLVHKHLNFLGRYHFSLPGTSEAVNCASYGTRTLDLRRVAAPDRQPLAYISVPLLLRPQPPTFLFTATRFDDRPLV